MIKPTKHNHPDKTIVYASFLLLKKLKKDRVVSYVTLASVVKNNIKSGAFLFLPALNFLFLLGLVKYHTKTDTFEYIGK